MSLSDGGAPTILTGRVILGSGQGGEAETTISELEARRSPMHFEEVEQQFWERVRDKATAKASKIMADAMAEAERIKAKAQEDGLRRRRGRRRKTDSDGTSQMADSWPRSWNPWPSNARTSGPPTVRISSPCSGSPWSGPWRDHRRPPRRDSGSLLNEALDLVDANGQPDPDRCIPTTKGSCASS